MTEISRIGGLVLVLMSMLTGAAEGQTRTEPLVFESGASAATVAGEIEGRAVAGYELRVEGGQTLSVALSADNPAAIFDVIRRGEPALAVFVGAREGRRFHGRLREGGAYTIRVHLARSAARRAETACYTLDVSLSAGAASGDGKADRAGPELMEVTGTVASLNLRCGPSSRSRVIAAVPAGTVMRNLGCRRAEGRRWCHVEPLDEQGLRGWVDGEFLDEAASSGAGDPGLPPDTDTGLARATSRHTASATGLPN